MDDALVLPAKLDLSAVTGLHKQMVDHSDQDVTLDLSEVTLFGALCLQVIIAAARQAKAANVSFTLSNASDHVLDQLRVMGVSPETIMEGQE